MFLHHQPVAIQRAGCENAADACFPHFAHRERAASAEKAVEAVMEDESLRKNEGERRHSTAKLIHCFECSARDFADEGTTMAEDEVGQLHEARAAGGMIKVSETSLREWIAYGLWFSETPIVPTKIWGKISQIQRDCLRRVCISHFASSQKFACASRKCCKRVWRRRAFVIAMGLTFVSGDSAAP
jgi:hypothetical protein